MTNIKRVSQKEIRASLSPGKLAEAPPSGISPVLRASWRFASNLAGQFNKQLLKDRTKEFLGHLVKKFV